MSCNVMCDKNTVLKWWLTQWWGCEFYFCSLTFYRIIVLDDFWSSRRKRKHLLCWPCFLWIYNKSIYFYTPRDVLCYFFTLRIAWLNVCPGDTCHEGVKIRLWTDGHTDYFHAVGQIRFVEVVKPKSWSWMYLCFIQPGWNPIKVFWSEYICRTLEYFVTFLVLA